MNSTVIHFAVLDPDRGVTPLCGEWRGDTSWTTAPEAVRCPGCGQRMRKCSMPDAEPSADAPPRFAVVSA